MYDQTIPRRIRARRKRLQLAGYQLAKAAGISPSYLSLIESGRKLPSVEVAERLAKALGEDPDLYRAWVESADDPDLDARVERLQKMQQLLDEPAAARRRPRFGLGKILHRRGRSRAGREVSDEADSDVREERSTFDLMPLASEPQHLVRSAMPVESLSEDHVGITEDVEAFRHATSRQVPLLTEGTDPARVDPQDVASAASISVDAALSPDNAGLLFAYRVSERGVERVKNLVRPGDTLVFAADPEGVDPAAIYAVRVNGRIVLSRIVYSAPTLLLLASDPYQDPITLDVGDEGGLFRALAGVVVTGIRTWPMPEPLERRGTRPSLGRSGKLEDGNIVRDCEWKENYGWRPVQKAEDLDYLDANPGTTVQFRLLRDGRVKYVLEMDADHWREALGSYYEGPTWRRNGYIVAITKRVSGEYTEEFQDRWAPHVRRPED